MIITCTECETKFMVKAESFGDKARKVRCGSCSHIWSQEPLNDEAVKAEVKVASEQKENLAAAIKAEAAGIKPALPIIVVAKTVPKWMKAAALLLVAANVIGFVVLNKPMIGQIGFYNTLGNYDTRGLAINNAQMAAINGDDKSVNLSWTTVNNGKTPLHSPDTRVRIFDKDLNVLHKGVDKQVAMIDGGKSIQFKDKKMSADGKYLVLDIGNPFEMLFR